MDKIYDDVITEKVESFTVELVSTVSRYEIEDTIKNNVSNRNLERIEERLLKHLEDGVIDLCFKKGKFLIHKSLNANGDLRIKMGLKLRLVDSSELEYDDVDSYAQLSGKITNMGYEP